MSLAYRFKAGGSGGVSTMAQTETMSHHHRSTTKQDHKPFKSKHATKSAIKDRNKGKVEAEDRGQRRSPHQQVMSKLQRRNQAKQLRINHKEKQDHESTIFQGVDGASKHIAVVPLSEDIDVRNTIAKLNESVDVSLPVDSIAPTRVRIDRFKRSLLYLPSGPDVLTALDACKLADWVIFLVKADQILGPDEDMLLRAIEGQGITSTAVVVTDLDSKMPANKRSKQLVEIKNQFSVYFAGLDKYTALENKSDCANLIRSLCTATTKGIRWRDDRSWMIIENVDSRPSQDGQGLTSVVLSGTVRGKGLNPDRLVHVPGWGEFKIKRIVEIPTQVHKRKASEMETDQAVREWLPNSGHDDLDELAPETAEMIDTTSIAEQSEQKGVLLDDHHYFSDDNSHIPRTPNKLPKGTSNYQAAWYLEDVSDSESDIMDEDGVDGDNEMIESVIKPEDGGLVRNEDAMTDVVGTEYPESEMHVDASADEEIRQLEEFRASRKQEAEEDLEFPDETELPPNVLARERLAKYRGLKSLRTSEWNTDKDRLYEPTDYQRLLQVPDYKKSYNSAIKEALAGGVPVGTNVEIELEEGPIPLNTLISKKPAALYSLLRHEHKQAVINLNITLSSEVEDPVRSKEELIVQIGHRRFAINPIFSASGQTPNDVHKFDRFLHPGRSATATFTGPLTWGSVPVLVFRHHKPTTVEDTVDAPALVSSATAATPPSSELSLIGTATTLPPSSTRVIAKRVVLTGHPFKIHKKLVTVRYMFFNREDVLWFQALPLFTKRGRQGWIKEPLGTHGYFKAIFDGNGKVNTMDAIGVSLYKRVWPRPSRRLE